eukprot:m.65902 g.65902  ORF g.65902 m.65902 type:complete len:303 (+) comp7598_c0_seq1:529-1437(+)
MCGRGSRAAARLCLRGWLGALAVKIRERAREHAQKVHVCNARKASIVGTMCIDDALLLLLAELDAVDALQDVEKVFCGDNAVAVAVNILQSVPQADFVALKDIGNAREHHTIAECARIARHLQNRGNLVVGGRRVARIGVHKLDKLLKVEAAVVICVKWMQQLNQLLCRKLDVELLQSVADFVDGQVAGAPDVKRNEQLVDIVRARTCSHMLLELVADELNQVVVALRDRLPCGYVCVSARDKRPRVQESPAAALPKTAGRLHSHRPDVASREAQCAGSGGTASSQPAGGQPRPREARSDSG